MPDEFVKKSDCETTSQKMLAGINELNVRLYRDNGTKSVQTQMSELNIAVTSLAKVLADHIKSDRTALSRRLNIAMKSMIIIGMLYGLIVFIVRTAPQVIQAI